ncbi:phosphotransferase family protein [Propionibacterium australiense]|nr:aminoglycoside phosphotransferase family protein [Propionibacterium australiense]RLP07683.1 aminoglycoside phosphotransferase family protein [Propionibacterium australiense]RLP08110.1 aminoglycoside phosphotransferase family protein [Propionibacterium australiense]
MSTRTRDVVAAVLDAGRLSELVGCRVRADHLRIKPDTSVTVSLAEPGTGRPRGWARILWPGGLSKADKTSLRAARRGLLAGWRTLPGGLVLQHGEILADPRLRRPLRRAVSRGLIRGRPEDTALRYNPLRRLVAQDDDLVLRVRAEPDPLGAELHAFVSAHVAVPDRVDDGQDPHLAVLRHTGDSDLGRRPDPAGSRLAGALVAALHRATDLLPGPLLQTLSQRVVDPQRQAAAHAGVLDALDQRLARRTRGLAARALAELPGPAVLVHGDASPDQVLTSADGRVWLTDFDRAHLAPAAADLGSWLMTADETSAGEFLAGYQEAGGLVPPGPQLRTALAGAILLRAVEPLRQARTDWGRLVGERLDRLEEVLR